MRRQKLSGSRDRANGPYFRYLGLGVGESDPSTIRSAASAMAGLLGDCEGHHGSEGLLRRRSEIAVAAYRLLDPRRRESFYERVQLSYPIDHQERTTEIQWLDFSVRQPTNPWTGTTESSGVSSGSSFDDRPVLMTRPVIERAIREEASDPIAAQAVAETMSWLDERREVIRSLRDSEPSAVSNSVFPFSWIRSVLGW